MSDLYPLLLLPDFRERPWGARDLAPLYPNYKVEGEPIGEVWLTGDECRVANGPLAGQTLADLCKQYGRDLVGEAAPEGHRFPLLLKFLFPRQKLSVQVHPTDEDARRAGLPCGKSECWYVLAAELDAQVALGLKPGATRSEFEAAARRGERADQLLNWISIRPGEMIYNPAGTLHSIGPGSILLETQQNSDITYRLYDYGRPRELHLEAGLAAMKASHEAGKVRSLDSAQGRTLLTAPHFVVEECALAEEREVPNATGSAQLLVALEGCGVVESTGRQPVSFARGEAVVVPASLPAFQLKPQWELRCLRATLPVPPGEMQS